ncbi:ABC transporter A like protein, partial [Aduncisulcus paluster]
QTMKKSKKKTNSKRDANVPVLPPGILSASSVQYSSPAFKFPTTTSVDSESSSLSSISLFSSGIPSKPRVVDVKVSIGSPPSAAFSSSRLGSHTYWDNSSVPVENLSWWEKRNRKKARIVRERERHLLEVEMNSHQALHAQDTHVIYQNGNVHAVRGISMDVKPGQCVALLGRNGAGKSTFLQAISGETPFQGTISVRGVTCADGCAISQGLVSLCSQKDLLWPDLTCIQHIQLVSSLHGREMSLLKIAELLQLAGLYKHRSKKSKELSGGMKRRLSLCVSLASSPSLVLTDEPSAGLDPRTQRLIWGLLEKARTVSSLVLTTHSMEEAEALCDHVIILEQGKIIARGTVNELRERYGRWHIVSIMFSRRSNTEDDRKFRDNAILKVLQDLQESVHIQVQGTRPTSVWRKLGSESFSEEDVDRKIVDVDVNATKSREAFLSIKMPMSVSISSVKSAIEKMKSSFHILSIYITTPSLEDIFLTIVSSDSIQMAKGR